MHVRDAFAMSTTPRAVERAPQPLSPACHAERPAASAGGRAREPIGLTTALGIQQIRWSICCSSPCVLRRPTVNVTRPAPAQSILIISIGLTCGSIVSCAGPGTNTKGTRSTGRNEIDRLR